ncbi:unnamed protein product, partial [Ectocarpus sp. 12 AP-2014]
GARQAQQRHGVERHRMRVTSSPQQQQSQTNEPTTAVPGLSVNAGDLCFEYSPSGSED